MSRWHGSRWGVEVWCGYCCQTWRTPEPGSLRDWVRDHLRSVCPSPEGIMERRKRFHLVPA